MKESEGFVDLGLAIPPIENLRRLVQAQSES